MTIGNCDVTAVFSSPSCTIEDVGSHVHLTLGVSGSMHSDAKLTAIGDEARACAEKFKTLGLLGDCFVEPDFRMTPDWLHDDDVLCTACLHAVAQRGRYTYALTELGRATYERLTGLSATATAHE